MRRKIESMVTAGGDEVAGGTAAARDSAGQEDQRSQEGAGATGAGQGARRRQANAEEAKLAKPQDKDQYNFTDPESRIMPGADGIVQGYNAQAAVEPTLLLIVGQTVTEASNMTKGS